ncbi:hypothetical protein ACFE04_012744 [Oxalis oulophora]
METEQIPKKPSVSKALLVLNCVLLAIGTCGGPLLMRLYFLHGGNRVWFSSWLATGAWPIFLFPLTVAYFQRHLAEPTKPTKIFLMKPPLFLVSAVIGLITGVDNYLYAYGVARLPVSTSSLIVASQLAFTAVFAYLLVKQKFDYYSMNAVFLLTFAAGILALNTSGDRPAGESSKEYIFGFLTTIGAAVLYGFILPLMELVNKKTKQNVDYLLVMEIQMVICLFATIFCTIGMIVNNDFKVIPRESRDFGLGETKYYVVVVITGIVWQGYFMGAIGVIFCSSSLSSAVLITVLLPVTEVLAVFFYKEKFETIKGVSLALSLWGFISYYYGEKKKMKKLEDKAIETELSQLADPGIFGTEEYSSTVESESESESVARCVCRRLQAGPGFVTCKRSILSMSLKGEERRGVESSGVETEETEFGKV